MTYCIDLENNFFGRQSVIDLLKRRVIDLKEGYRQNIAFLGNRHIGKTSILLKFVKDLDDEAVISLYLDLDHKDFDYVFHKFAGSLLYGYLRQRNLPLHEDLDLLMESARKHIPQTVNEIKRVQTNFQKGKISEAYRELIALPEVFTIESGKFCLIIIDEFHNLDELDLSSAFQDLGKKIMTQKRCLYIVTSSLGDIAKQILTEKLSLLFGHFEVVQIDFFDLKTAQEFIGRNLQEIQMGTILKNFLIDFTGGHPFYLNIICQEIVSLSVFYNQKEVYLPLLSQALEHTIFSRWGILSRHFDLMLHHLSYGKGNGMIPRLMIALANGQTKVKDLAEKNRFRKTYVKQKFSRLLDLGVVSKNGNVYHFQDKLLKYWLKYVFQKRISAIDVTPDKCQEQFRKEIEQLVYAFRIASQKELSTRIIELLHCFDNEAFQINGRKYKLPIFRDVVPFYLKEYADQKFQVIKAHAESGTWFIILKEGMLDEGEVNVFLQGLRKMNPKPQKRIVISLTDLDANARLRALQEKMWIWNEGELNTLLSLYDKPYIVK